MAKSSRRKRDLQGWLGAAGTPVFVIDRELRLRVFNEGCEKLTGWKADELLGQECRYASVSDELTPAALGNSLSPPPEAMSGHEVSAPAYLPSKKGVSLARMLHFFPIHDASGEQTAVLGLIANIPPTPAAPAISPARQLHAELAALRMQLRERFGPHSLITRSPAMKKLLAQLQLAQNCTASVLLEGETGSGREHLARHIHFGGASRGQWFVPLDCRRLDPQDLARVVERLQEVHRPEGSRARSASSGATPLPGTVYLADVEALPRDLQEQIVAAFGATEAGRAPALRVMAGSAAGLDEEVAAGRVLPELHTLVSTLTLKVPALRNRGDDLQLLAQHFLEEVNRDRSGGKQVAGFDEAVWPLFLRYNWPGNLDELATVVREAHERSEQTLVRAEDLPFRFRTALDAQELPPVVTESWPATPLDPLLTKVETRLITLALERSKYNKSRAAELLGINRARLYRRMEQLGIEDREGPGEAAGDAPVSS